MPCWELCKVFWTDKLDNSRRHFDWELFCILFSKLFSQKWDHCVFMTLKNLKKCCFNLVHPIMLTHSTPRFLSKFPLLINAWNNKTFDKILAQECQEKKVNWHQCIEEYDKQMFIYVVQRKEVRKDLRALLRTLQNIFFLRKTFTMGVWKT